MKINVQPTLKVSHDGNPMKMECSFSPSEFAREFEEYLLQTYDSFKTAEIMKELETDGLYYLRYHEDKDLESVYDYRSPVGIRLCSWVQRGLVKMPPSLEDYCKFLDVWIAKDVPSLEYKAPVTKRDGKDYLKFDSL